MPGGVVTTDVGIVGGGIVGLATAVVLRRRYPDLSVTLLEAEGRVAAHQSGHNSGVLHTGLYYRPGSHKAICCREGKAAMEAFCEEQGVAWDRCGKVVVATREEELPRLEKIAERATENGVEFTRIDTDRLRELEPHVAGIAALHVPGAGIVDYRVVCEAMARVIGSGKAGGSGQAGGVRLGCDVVSVTPRATSVVLGGRGGERVECGRWINCGGLRSDRVYRMAGGETDVQIVPFRGEYYELTEAGDPLCRNLIYPVPDPAFPFLGVHFTRMIGGGVECGPNAVLALSRGGYRWTDIAFGDLTETLRFGGFLRLARKHWRMGLAEMHRSLSKEAFVRALQKLIPSIRARDLKPGRSGVRAQAVGPDGELVDDFLFAETERAVHVLNAPSPAATASLAIAERIVDRLPES